MLLTLVMALSPLFTPPFFAYVSSFFLLSGEAIHTALMYFDCSELSHCLNQTSSDGIPPEKKRKLNCASELVICE